MRACPACGASNEATDDFCGNCGGYLGWSDSDATADAGSDTDAAADAARTPSEPAPDAPSPLGSDDSHPAAAAVPDDSHQPAAAVPGDMDTMGPAPRSGPAQEPAAPRAGEAAEVQPAGGTNGSADRAPTAEAPDDAPLPAPGSPRTNPPDATELRRPEPTPRPTQRPTPRPTQPAPAPGAPREAAPQPVKPAKAAAPRPVVRPVTADDDAAGVPCPACRTLNPPHRRFCRRCAAPLATVAPPAPLPWWRTVWPLRRRTRAGSGRMVRLLVILAVVLALCAGGFLLLPAGRHLFEDTRDKLGKPTAVTPAQVKATAELPGHPAKNTTDGLSNRYWAMPGPGASVTYTFNKPFRLVDVLITNGASKNAEDYARQGRALRMDMEVTAQDGQVRRKQLTLSDKPGPQTFPVGISATTTIRLTLSSPAGLVRGRHIAVAEVEFFRRT